MRALRLRLKCRYKVLAFLCLLSTITFVDRVCMSIAGPSMQHDLNISPSQWGWVVGSFAVAYGLFEIPTGILGDRIGPRRVLTRVVVWWSTFTCLTGGITSRFSLLLVRFLFGAGEAGAYPNSSLAISRWFPANERAIAHGALWMASRIGGAAAPILITPIQRRFGWRVSFYVFGAVGFAWGLAWYAWFRDKPSEKPGVSEEELAENIRDIGAARLSLPWRIALKCPNFVLLLFMYHCVAYGNYFYLSWLPTYLEKGRHFDQSEVALFSTLPFLLGAFTNLLGGGFGDHLIGHIGLKWGRRLVGAAGLGVASVMLLVAALAEQRIWSVIGFGLAAGAADFMLPNCWATCLDIGQGYVGSITSAMNTAGQIGSFFSAVFFGYAVEAWQSYNAPIIPLAFMTFLGALCWLKIDATKMPV